MTDTMTPDELAALAKGLTEAQKRALAAPKWSMMGQYNAGILEILALGLLVNDGLGHALSPTGLALRAFLLERG